MGNKLTKDELTSASRRLRGKRSELATRAKVSEGTVNNTFEGRYQNEKVLTAIRDMLLEQEKIKENPVVAELREILAVSQSI
jgi:hypothetical protein